MKPTGNIASIYPIPDDGCVMVHLRSHDWDFESFGLVSLSVEANRFTMRYVGSGDQKGVAVLKLVPLQKADDTITKIIGLLHLDPKNIGVSRGAG